MTKKVISIFIMMSLSAIASGETHMGIFIDGTKKSLESLQMRTWRPKTHGKIDFEVNHVPLRVIFGREPNPKPTGWYDKYRTITKIYELDRPNGAEKKMLLKKSGHRIGSPFTDEYEYSNYSGVYDLAGIGQPQVVLIQSMWRAVAVDVFAYENGKMRTLFTTDIFDGFVTSAEEIVFKDDEKKGSYKLNFFQTGEIEYVFKYSSRLGRYILTDGPSQNSHTPPDEEWISMTNAGPVAFECSSRLARPVLTRDPPKKKWHMPSNKEWISMIREQAESDENPVTRVRARVELVHVYYWLGEDAIARKAIRAAKAAIMERQNSPEGRLSPLETESEWQSLKFIENKLKQ